MSHAPETMRIRDLIRDIQKMPKSQATELAMMHAKDVDKMTKGKAEFKMVPRLVSASQNPQVLVSSSCLLNSLVRAPSMMHQPEQTDCGCGCGNCGKGKKHCKSAAVADVAAVTAVTAEPKRNASPAKKNRTNRSGDEAPAVVPAVVVSPKQVPAAAADEPAVVTKAPAGKAPAKAPAGKAPAKAPVASKSAAKAPVASKSAAKAPGAAKPAANAPVASKSAAKAPVAAKSAAKASSAAKAPAAAKSASKAQDKDELITDEEAHALHAMAMLNIHSNLAAYNRLVQEHSGNAITDGMRAGWNMVVEDCKSLERRFMKWLDDMKTACTPKHSKSCLRLSDARAADKFERDTTEQLHKLKLIIKEHSAQRSQAAITVVDVAPPAVVDVAGFPVDNSF